MVAGSFTHLGPSSRNGLGRLQPDGNLDAGFQPDIAYSYFGYIRSLAMQGDGKILLGGSFTYFQSGIANSSLARVNTDGTRDTNFNSRIANSGAPVTGLAVQQDGSILAGGQFASVGGVSRTNIARLMSDGQLDTNFLCSADQPVNCILQQSDGKILLGGSFFSVSGVSRRAFVRLINTAPVSDALSFDGSTLSWLRGGPGPELLRTRFETGTNGQLAILGDGTRIPGGWQWAGLSLPTDSTFRARGFDAAGSSDNPIWNLEVGAGKPVVTNQPISQTLPATSSATFSAGVAGGPPLTYQWWNDGVCLTNGGNISGSSTATLTLTNVFATNSGSYFVIASNNFGATTSAVATLVVTEPAILVQPVAQDSASR